MSDPRFFSVVGPFTLSELAAKGEAELVANADGAVLVYDVAPLDQATERHISFLDNRKYMDAFSVSKARAALVLPELAHLAPDGMTVLLSKDPYRSYALIAQMFYPRVAPEPWVAPTACIDPSAKIAADVRIEPGVVIRANAEIGARCLIGANAVIGQGVSLGEDCIIGPNSSIAYAIIGKRVNIYPGVRIGQDGFGFAMGPKGYVKVPQLGRVVIGNDVEVGANSTIDRGAGPDTVIGDGTMIDNLVQIGHNVRMGRGCVMVSQSGISGSTHLGDYVVIAGQAGLTGHLKIGTGAKIGAQAGVMRDVEPGETVGGSPAVAMKDWLRHTAILQRMIKDKGRGDK